MSDKIALKLKSANGILKKYSLKLYYYETIKNESLVKIPKIICTNSDLKNCIIDLDLSLDNIVFYIPSIEFSSKNYKNYMKNLNDLSKIVNDINSLNELELPTVQFAFFEKNKVLIKK